MLVITALVTPFDAQGEIDFATLETLINRQIAAGIDGIVLCGATGEGVSLSFEEKVSIFRFGAELVQKRTQLFAYSCTSETKSSYALSLAAKQAGMDAILATFPYYNRPTHQGCMLHFSKVLEVGLPMILYYHPGRTGVRFTTNELRELLTLDGVIGLKDSSQDPTLAYELSLRDVYCGDDLLAPAYFAYGAKGVISVVSNLLPNVSDFKAIYPLCKALGLEVNPQGIKYALEVAGLMSADCRLPLIRPQESTQKAIRAAMSLFFEKEINATCHNSHRPTYE